MLAAEQAEQEEAEADRAVVLRAAATAGRGARGGRRESSRSGGSGGGGGGSRAYPYRRAQLERLQVRHCLSVAFPLHRSPLKAWPFLAPPQRHFQIHCEERKQRVLRRRAGGPGHQCRWRPAVCHFTADKLPIMPRWSSHSGGGGTGGGGGAGTQSRWPAAAAGEPPSEHTAR